MIRIAIDAMGGDLAPAAIVKGAIDSLSSCPNTKLLLYGEEKAIQEECAKYQYDKERIEIIPCSENISLHESPVMAIRRKKDSAIFLVKPFSANSLACRMAVVISTPSVLP